MALNVCLTFWKYSRHFDQLGHFSYRQTFLQTKISEMLYLEQDLAQVDLESKPPARGWTLS